MKTCLDDFKKRKAFPLINKYCFIDFTFNVHEPNFFRMLTAGLTAKNDKYFLWFHSNGFDVYIISIILFYSNKKSLHTLEHMFSFVKNLAIKRFYLRYADLGSNKN